MSSLDAATWGYCPHCRREVETRRMRGALRLIGHRVDAAFPSDCEGSHGPPGVPPGDGEGDWSWVSDQEREARVTEVAPRPARPIWHGTAMHLRTSGAGRTPEGRGP